ncbi:MAG: Gfo/Idh/MocA family protein [Planctomycetota bacterium]|jgi:predicted dehydrogenase
MKSTKSKRLTRRSFLARSAAAAAAVNIIPRHVLGAAGKPSANEKLNIGCVGVGGMQGASDVRNVSRENIYAICDVDLNHLNKSAGRYTSAKKYRDFRVMLDKEHKNLHAVTVTIPDHMHASVSLWAMERGLGVYCQKPLTQSVWEARLMAKAAKKYKVATQMGNQGYSCEATRVACELIWDGRLGEVTEVHSMSRGGFARNVRRWPQAQKVPAHLNWDHWLGRAQARPYVPKVHPVQWRGYLDFGTQMIGDWGVHMLGPANMGLALGSPKSVTCLAVEGVNPVTYPSYAVQFEFPERPCKHVPSGKMPPLKLTWYEGRMTGMFKLPPAISNKAWRGNNTLFVGTKGYMGTRGRGEGVRLLPESAMKDFKKPPRVIERVRGGHHGSWIRSCKEGGEPTCSNFTIAGPYVEWLLLGAISWRFPRQKLLWDGKRMRFTNNYKANQFIKPRFRKGWELKDIV